MEPEEENFIEPENDNLEDTKPRKALPEREDAAPDLAQESEAQEDLAQTRASAAPSISGTPHSTAPADGLFSISEAGEAPDQAETRAMPPARRNEEGYSETIPPPADMSPPAAPPGEPPQAASWQASDGRSDERAAAPAARPRPAAKKGGKPPVKRVAKKRPSARWLLWLLAGMAILLVIALVGAGSGYSAGIELRKQAQGTQAAGSAMDQFQRGLEDMAQGNYYRAQQRFEYVIRLDPGFPGAADKLAEAIMYANATATPTTPPTPTLTPTPDTRAVDDLWNQAQNAMGSKDWNAAIDALLALRGKDINFHVVDVDGMLFIALRNRGYQKITQADLESGIYDLSLASNFGPLDSEAEGLMSWSQMYITGASFWGIDWQQVIDYFVQVAPQMPNLMDNSGLTATERLRQAYFEYGNQLASQGQACKALELYQQSLAIAPNSEVETAMNTVAKQCGGGEAQGTPGDPQKTPKKNKTPTP